MSSSWVESMCNDFGCIPEETLPEFTFDDLIKFDPPMQTQPTTFPQNASWMQTHDWASTEAYDTDVSLNFDGQLVNFDLQPRHDEQPQNPVHPRPFNGLHPVIPPSLGSESSSGSANSHRDGGLVLPPGHSQEAGGNGNTLLWEHLRTGQGGLTWTTSSQCRRRFPLDGRVVYDNPATTPHAPIAGVSLHAHHIQPATMSQVVIRLVGTVKAARAFAARLQDRTPVIGQGNAGLASELLTDPSQGLLQVTQVAEYMGPKNATAAGNAGLSHRMPCNKPSFLGSAGIGWTSSELASGPVNANGGLHDSAISQERPAGVRTSRSPSSFRQSANTGMLCALVPGRTVAQVSSLHDSPTLLLGQPSCRSRICQPPSSASLTTGVNQRTTSGSLSTIVPEQAQGQSVGGLRTTTTSIATAERAAPNSISARGQEAIICTPPGSEAQQQGLRQAVYFAAALGCLMLLANVQHAGNPIAWTILALCTPAAGQKGCHFIARFVNPMWRVQLSNTLRTVATLDGALHKSRVSLRCTEKNSSWLAFEHRIRTPGMDQWRGRTGSNLTC